jgi:hypothetical protein
MRVAEPFDEQVDMPFSRGMIMVSGPMAGARSVSAWSSA